MTPNEKLMREALEQIINSVPTFSDGSFFIEHYDFNGEPQGSEQVDPVGIVRHLEGIAHRALATAEQPARQDAAYAELRALAEKATLGPWWTEPNYADNGEYCGLDVVTPGAVIINGENAPNDDDATYIAAANPAAILTLLADNDRLTERVRDLETAANGIAAGTVSFMAKERAAQDERVAVLEEQVTTLKNIMALQNVALESKAELQTLAEDYPHANEAAKVEFAEYREKARIAIVDLFQRMEKSYAAEPTRRITMMDLDAVFHHVKELGLGGCLDGAAPPSPAEEKNL